MRRSSSTTPLRSSDDHRVLPKHVAKINCIMKKQTGEVVVDGVSTVKLPGWLMKT